jgi:hypothetical protein
MTKYERLEQAKRKAEASRDTYSMRSIFWMLYDEQRAKYETEIGALTIEEASEEVPETAKE